MEILSKLLDNQDSLEDALRLESTPEEVKETKYGRKLLRWVRRRRRVTNRVVKALSKF
jgi:hypothetical protein